MDRLLDYLIGNGIDLHYLRSIAGRWEAYVRQRTSSDSESIHYTIGYGAASEPILALANAIDAFDRDAVTSTVTLTNPVSQPANFDFNSILANLRQQNPSKVQFKFKF